MGQSMSPVAAGAVKAGVAGAVVAIILFRTRKLPAAEMGFARPPLQAALLFLAIYRAWMFGTDAVLHWRGPWDWGPWIAAPLLASALRVLAVCVLGPTGEELLFRGWLFGFLLRRIGTAATIVVTAAAWAVLHYTYSLPVIGVIFVDGLLLGLARWKTRSLFPPIVMHMLYNLYAIW